MPLSVSDRDPYLLLKVACAAPAHVLVIVALQALSLTLSRP